MTTAKKEDSNRAGVRCEPAGNEDEAASAARGNARVGGVARAGMPVFEAR
jgi:hypothetical protein